MTHSILHSHSTSLTVIDIDAEFHHDASDSMFQSFPLPSCSSYSRISFRAMAMSQWAEQRSVSRRLVGPRALPKHLVEWHQFGSNTLKCTFLGLFPFFESLQWAWLRFQPRIPIFDGFWLSDVFRKFSDSLSDLPEVSGTQTIPDQSSNVLPEFWRTWSHWWASRIKMRGPQDNVIKAIETSMPEPREAHPFFIVKAVSDPFVGTCWMLILISESLVRFLSGWDG